jgi:hypothetical protein
VLALAFHVDYWDSIGWADRFGSPAWTARQQEYARRRGFTVYTPQLVIDGRADSVGSQRGSVVAAITRAKASAHAARASITRDGNRLSLSVGTLADPTDASGKLLLASFDDSRSTRIRAGENSGREIAYTSIVRSLRVLRDWRNAPLQISETLRAEEVGERLALIVQGEDGTVWALTSTP